MHTWDIAKLFIESCSSPEDVDWVIVTLQDPDAVQQVCSLLIAFSSNKPSASRRKAEAPTIQGVGSYRSSTKIDTLATGKGEADFTRSSKDAIASQLESLFRSSGMTNRQVEQWVTGNFAIRVAIGKGSLHEYLAKVLKNADLGLTNRILSAVHRLVREEGASTSDIQNYWDGFDKRFSVTE